MRRQVVLLVASAVLASGCGAFSEVRGPGTPECTSLEGSLSAATIIQAQAVPAATVGPCITELKVGWDYSSQEAESGRATFWLDSDRMGDRFVAVSLLEACDSAGALPAASPFAAEGVERFVDVREEPVDFPITIVPANDRVVTFATSVARALEAEDINGRDIALTIADVRAEVSPSVPIVTALRRGEAVVIVSDRHLARFLEEMDRTNEEKFTVELQRPNEEIELDIDLDEAIDEIEDDAADPRYLATWYHLFDGGCIVYDFDAVGFGSETVAIDIDESLGVFPLAELREGARQAGYDI